MGSISSFWVSPCLQINSGIGQRHVGRVFSSLGSGESSGLPSESFMSNGAPVVKEKEKIGSGIDGGNGHMGSIVGRKKREKDVAPEKLDALWDDGFRTTSMKDYLDAAKDMIKPDGGLPRWFCPVECGCPLKDSPLLLFLPGNVCLLDATVLLYHGFWVSSFSGVSKIAILPTNDGNLLHTGMDGVGFGLIMHHKPLGKACEVWCLHIPVYDRTPFEGLVECVEQIVRDEHASSPNKPIYLVGDSFGGCLALAVAAHNPSIDLVLILANPATSLKSSQLRPFFPLLEDFSDELHTTIPYLLSFIMGEPFKMAMVNVEPFPPAQMVRSLLENLTALLPCLSVMADIIPKETLIWKLKLLKSAAAHANSRLHAVQAEVLVLASRKDNMLPSEDEAKRLSSLLKNCKVRNFKDNGHTLLLEDSISLLIIIKGTRKYRRSQRVDYVSDFLPPSMSEFKHAFDRVYGLVNFVESPVMFSTVKDRKIVKGLDGVPVEGPVLLVGYHMLMGLELYNLLKAFLPTSFFNLLSSKSHVLLYPGGAREALHRRGEAYKLLWPDQPEFVRMAARFGATIVPFGVVGEDDLLEFVLDYDDQMRIPIWNEYLRQNSGDMTRARANGDLFIPGVLPKLPGRFYYLFAQPIETKGKEEMLMDKDNAKELYLQIKSEVESCLAYLLKKREEDPYRNIIDRTIYRAFYAPAHDVPTFSP
ncbi:hypothetical protein Ancab_000844 [Ancistrocladus abbreviatus]